MAVARRLCPRAGWRHRRGAGRQHLRRLAVYPRSLGACRPAPPRHRPGIAAPRRGPCARARLPLCLARHVFVPGAGILSEIRLSRVRPSRLSARPAANFLPEAADAGGVTCQSASKLPAYARFVADSLLEKAGFEPSVPLTPATRKTSIRRLLAAALVTKGRCSRPSVGQERGDLRPCPRSST